MSSELSLHIAGEDAMQALGARLGRTLPAGAVIYLKGDLGAGKTTLVRGYLRALGQQSAVKSPTYTLIEPYELAGRRFYHLDLYRVKDPEEVDYLGLRELVDGESTLLVEWPEHGAEFVPAADLVIDIAYQGPARRVTLRAGSERGRQLLEGFGAS